MPETPFKISFSFVGFFANGFLLCGADGSGTVTEYRRSWNLSSIRPSGSAMVDLRRAMAGFVSGTGERAPVVCWWFHVVVSSALAAGAESSTVGTRAVWPCDVIVL